LYHSLVGASRSRPLDDLSQHQQSVACALNSGFKLGRSHVSALEGLKAVFDAIDDISTPEKLTAAKEVLKNMSSRFANLEILCKHRVVRAVCCVSIDYLHASLIILFFMSFMQVLANFLQNLTVREGAGKRFQDDNVRAFFVLLYYKGRGSLIAHFHVRVSVNHFEVPGVRVHLIVIFFFLFSFQEMFNGPSLNTIKSWLPKDHPDLPFRLADVTDAYIKWVLDYMLLFGYTGHLRSAKDDTPSNRLLVWDEKRQTVVGGPEGESRSFTLRSDGREIQRYVDETVPKVIFHPCNENQLIFMGLSFLN
jgi:hypothetical protein